MSMVSIEGKHADRRRLYVSAVLGGGGAHADVVRDIRTTAGIVRRADEAIATGDMAREATVDCTFHVPGSLIRPDFVGFRTGRWVKAKQLLVVQVAVPQSIVGRQRRLEFLGDALLASVRVASEYLAIKRIDLTVTGASEVAARAVAELELLRMGRNP
jgi:hypothetical protein